MNTAHKLGRPEWASDDDESAAEFAATINPAEVAELAQTIRADWYAAAAYYWAAAHDALTKRDFRLMRLNARIAGDAEHRASLDGVLIATVFGVYERPAERPVQIGRKLPPEGVAQARALVRAEIAPSKPVVKNSAPKIVVTPAKKPHHIAVQQFVRSFGDDGCTKDDILGAGIEKVSEITILEMKTQKMLVFSRKGKIFA